MAGIREGRGGEKTGEKEAGEEKQTHNPMFQRHLVLRYL